MTAGHVLEAFFLFTPVTPARPLFQTLLFTGPPSLLTLSLPRADPQRLAVEVLGPSLAPGPVLARVAITVPQITMAEPTDFYFAQLWSLESPRGRFWPIQCLVRAGFLAHRMLPCLCVLLWPLLGMCLCVYIYICAWGRVP